MSAVTPNREFEIKFKSRPDQIQSFKKAVNAAAGNRRAWPKKDMISRYFDTPEQDMRQRSVSIRLRTSKGKTVQTVKAKSAKSGAGVMDRSEWEQAVTGDLPDLEILPAVARDAIGDLADDALHAVIEVRIHRQTMMIRRQSPIGPDLVIEAAADTCRVLAGGREDAFCECELELVEGDVNAFFNVVSEIHTKCALPISGLTKAGRGYRLLEDKGISAFRVPKFALRADQTIHDALSGIFPVCIANIVDNEEACLDGTDPEGVHQMRVSVRRLRTSLKVFRDYLDPARISWMEDDLKWLGNALGPARDWDVYIGEMLAPVNGYGIDADAVGALRDAAEEKRADAYALVRETLGSERYAKLMFRLTAFATMAGWRAMPPDPDDPLMQRLGDSAAAILEKPHRKLLKKAKNLADLDIEQRHGVRIRLKKLRYAVDFLRGVYPGSETRKFLKTLQRLQDQFGHLNDVAQVMRMTDDITANTTTSPTTSTTDEAGAANGTRALASGLVQGWYAHALKETETQLIKDWKTFAAARPFWKPPA